MSICQRQLNRSADAIPLLKQLQNEKLSEDQANNVAYELGLAQVASKQIEQAIETFQALIQSSTQFPLLDKVYYELAWAQKANGDTAKANEAFRQLTTAYPNSSLAAEAFFHVGQSEYENSKYDRAIKAYTVAATRSVDVALLEKSTYKLGWAYFQQQQYDKAIEQFAKQAKDFPQGTLSTDASFMIAESLLKLQKYAEAWPQYEITRSKLESDQASSVSNQVKSLLYLHGAQAARELKKWKEVENWVGALQSSVPDSPHLAVAKYELAYAKQNQKKPLEALQLYSEIAEEQRNEVGARSRFMMGEVFFADREFAKAISEFQKVMYGYGGTQAPEEIKNWQARSAFEAGRCSEVLISDQAGDKRKKAIDIAKKFYDFVINNHETHTLAKQAQNRIAELGRM
jgi:TolA-binding protein